MSRAASPATKKAYGLKRVCEVWDIPRSRIYKREKEAPMKRGPKPRHTDEEIVKLIKEDLEASPFKAEGHRKVHVRLKRGKGTTVGRNRVLRLMRQEGLLSPHRSVYRPANPHTGRITTDAPNEMWGSDGTKILTVDEGWIWVFTVADHWNTECMGWNVCKHGDRFATFDPISRAIKSAYGEQSKGIAKGLKLRIDNGTQYTSDYFLQQLNYLGVEPSFGLVRQPQTNGVAERFHRTLKEQILEGRSFKNADEVREAVRNFIEVYNSRWMVAKRDYQSPMEARRNYDRLKGAA